MKKNILFIGEHPLLQYGNSHMLRAILDRLDYEKFEATCYVSGKMETLKKHPYHIVLASDSEDYWGEQKLLVLLANMKVDAIFMVGLDIWRYGKIFDQIKKIQIKRNFKWIALFPYDIQSVRKDWVDWINMVDFPLVYSEYGYHMIEDKVPGLQYFRPSMDSHELYVPYPPEKRMAVRRKHFRTVKDDQFIIGFIGPNQIRKDIQTLIKAFQIVKDKHPEAVLYLHTEMEMKYNLHEYLRQTRLAKGDVFAKAKGTYPEKVMPEIFNSLDCFINCSFQEGLSWTVLSALACGVPTIASDSTAHIELLKNSGLLVPCEEDRYLSLNTVHGVSWLDAKGCHQRDIAKAINMMIEVPEIAKEASKRGPRRAAIWLENTSDVNRLLEEATKESFDVIVDRIPKVLFAQHSAAGDVLMTTRCFKGIKEIYGFPMVYMTSPEYMNIVEGNPYVDEVIPWDESLLHGKYVHVLNPHGDRIAPGHWGRNSNSILSDFYWKLLNIEPDDFFINLKKPDMEYFLGYDLLPLTCIVHTTGGDPHFRTYEYMPDVCKELGRNYTTIQVGGKEDAWAGADIDCRGRLSFQETAWVMDKAVLAITVDSFVSHLAGALGISQVCLFGSGNVNVVRPNQVKGELVCLSPDYVRICPGLGPCSAAVRDCPAPCTGSHDPINILKAVEQIQSNGNIRRDHEKGMYSIQYAE